MMMTIPHLLAAAGLAEVVALSVAETRRSAPPRRRAPRWRPPRWLRITAIAAAAAGEIIATVLLVPRYPMQTAVCLQADVVAAVLAMTVRHQIGAPNRPRGGRR